jgi:hypothetical protein
VEGSRGRIFQSGLKTAGGATVVVYMAPSWRLRRVHVEEEQVDATDCVVPYYPCFVICVLLNRRDIIVFLIF